MIVCLDVDYRRAAAVAGCVGISDWAASSSQFEGTHYQTGRPCEYQAGEFSLRELPCLLAAIEALAKRPTLIVIDGYVWLGNGKRGLGAHLHHALAENIPVVGVAKSRFHSATLALEVLRGTSQSPLFVTAAGLAAGDAAAGVKSMAGPHRIPAMIKRADRLCRDAPLTRS